MKLGFLASHGGSNMQAILKECESGALPALPALLICNNPDATAMDRARKAGIPATVLNRRTHPNADALDLAIAQHLLDAAIDLVVLAGYMKKIGPATLSAFSNRILNIHPSLLPKFGGKGMYGIRVHEAVINAGESESGATVHLVDNGYDRGRILQQVKVPVNTDDTPESLQRKVLRAEHELYPKTLAAIASGRIKLPLNPV